MNITRTEKFNVNVAKAILNNLDECDVAEVQITYKIDLEKELKDIKGNIGSALATVRDNGKESSMIKSLKAAKDKIDMIVSAYSWLQLWVRTYYIASHMLIWY